MSRSNPASFAPAVPLPTDYLQLPAPVSTSNGSQQLSLCDQGVCKPDTAVKQVKLLANVCPWLEESTCATASPSEVRAASLRTPRAPHSAPTFISNCIYTLASARLRIICTQHLHFAIPDLLQRSQVGLKDNMTAVLLKHQHFATPTANLAQCNGRCVLPPVVTRPIPYSLRPCRTREHNPPACPASTFPSSHMHPAGTLLATRYALSPVPQPHQASPAPATPSTSPTRIVVQQ